VLCLAQKPPRYADQQNLAGLRLLENSGILLAKSVPQLALLDRPLVFMRLQPLYLAHFLPEIRRKFLPFP
jgi:hypothetical protein